MKKILLSLFFGLTAVAGMAQTTTNYTEDLVVTVDGTSADKIPANIIVKTNTDGTCDFTLKNFIMVLGKQSMPVGTINLQNVSMKQEDGYNSIETHQTIEIEDGDEDVSPFWIGAGLGEVPINLTGKFNSKNLYATINIQMEVNDELQDIKVVVGQDIISSIANAIANKNAKQIVYTLNGVRVSANTATKGVYIINGKKVIK